MKREVLIFHLKIYFWATLRKNLSEFYMIPGNIVGFPKDND